MKNKKGFTLVELLAVIAILAILVIVAMPNVLGMFNEAKQNTFVTEVQKYIDTAKAQFTNDAFKNQGKTIYYSSEYNDDLKTSKLDMDGNKEYFIEMDRHGDFKRIVIYDENFCYDIYDDGTNWKVGGTKSKKISDIDKNSIIKDDIWESGDDKLNISVDGDEYIVVGCRGDKTVTGKTTNVVLDKVKIDGVEYDFIPGMTWKEWVNSSYNVSNIKVNNYVYIDACNASCGIDKSLRYGSFTYFDSNLDDENPGGITSFDWVMENHQIIKDSSYVLQLHYDLPGIARWLDVGEKYYDFNDNNGNVVYNQELKTNSIPYFACSPRYCE